MRVGLICPDSPFLLDSRVFPTLGVLQVAASLLANHHEVGVLDLSGVPNPISALESFLSPGYDCIGITGTSPQLPAVMQIFQNIKMLDSSVRVIIGGPHATVDPSSLLMFDSVVMGDGEEAILTAIQKDSPKIIDQASNVVKGILPYHRPARQLIDMSSYEYSLAGIKGTSALSSSGCPYNCGFCCGRSSPFYRRVRTRDLSDLRNEMIELQEIYGINAVMFFDDELSLDDKYTLQLCSTLAPLGMKFRGFVKANLFTSEQAEAFAKAGFVELCTGVEAAHQRILDVMEKKTTPAINKRFVDLCRQNGIRSKCFTSIGHPSESEETVFALRDWLIETRPDEFDITVISVYPSSPYWDNSVDTGESIDGKKVRKYVKKSRNLTENGATLFFEEVDYTREFSFYKGKPGEYTSHVWTPELSKQDLVRLRDQTEDQVRSALSLSYPKRHSGDNFEGSMGMGASPQNTHKLLKVLES